MSFSSLTFNGAIVLVNGFGSRQTYMFHPYFSLVGIRLSTLFNMSVREAILRGHICVIYESNSFTTKSILVGWL